MSESLWQKVGPFLSPFAKIYEMGVVLRNFSYDHHLAKVTQLPVKVISVGNLTVGGSGKTPVTLSLAKLIDNLPSKKKPAILLRGYRRRGSGFRIVSSGEGSLCSWEESGDEAQIYARRLKSIPVAVDADRVRGGRALIEQFSPSVILLDDGFQHRRLHRDLDIVLLNHRGEYLTDRLLPAGRLRESPGALKRAHFIVLNRYQPDDTKSDDFLSHCVETFGEAKIAACRVIPSQCTNLRDGQPFRLDSLRGKRLIPFCGIANPESFLETLQKLDPEIPFLVRFPDHHAYKPRDAGRLADAFTKNNADYLITTEKDAVKLGGLFEALPILVLEIEIEWLLGLDNLKGQISGLFSKTVEN
ncbi:MAG TPA: tetraacyldisaccharide 4'-kinase [Bacteroidetes bacterium]|nr:tetraacyldisaccharide 4'-kinase [Bacteroidota bacterium]